MKNESTSLKTGLSKFCLVKSQPAKLGCPSLNCTKLKSLCATLNYLTAQKLKEANFLCVKIMKKDVGSSNFSNLSETGGDVMFSVLENGNLVRKNGSLIQFITEVRIWTIKGIFHSYI
jgi:hypothetical protein